MQYTESEMPTAPTERQNLLNRLRFRLNEKRIAQNNMRMTATVVRNLLMGISAVAPYNMVGGRARRILWKLFSFSGKSGNSKIVINAKITLRATVMISIRPSPLL